MSATERRKGRAGQAAAKRLLLDRDWTVAGTESGSSIEDIVGIDPDNKIWAIEVKNTRSITTAHRAKAMLWASRRRAHWMLMNHIAGTSSWLIQRQGERPVVWREKPELPEKTDEKS